VPVVNLPPGCKSLAFEDGKRYIAARAGGQVTVSDQHARDIDKIPGNGTAGLVTGQFRAYGGRGKPGRVCTACGRISYPWSMTCPRESCGAPTKPESGSAA
jgi:hypothetical protein